LDFFVENFQIFLLVFARMFGMFAVAPFFSSGVIPMRIRAIFSVYVAVAIFPMVANYIGKVPENMFSYAIVIGSEAVIGILIGFIVSIIFSSFQLAARFFSFQMALGIAEVVDPFAEVGITMVGQLWTLMGILIFIAIDGPHMLIMATFDSYESIRIFNIMRDSTTVFVTLVQAFGAMFFIALKLAFPILMTLLLLTITIGMLAKAAPQMNIFMIGLPLQIAVGFLIMFIVIGDLAFGMQSALTKTFSNLLNFIHMFGR